MEIVSFVASLLALFSLQYSYDKYPDPKGRIDFIDGVYKSCVHKGDLPFKKGSNTFPRSELRYLDEQVDGKYELIVGIKNISVSADFDFSYYQLFGGSPIMMIRHRVGQLQMVVFKGKPKIQEIKSLPTRCEILCGRNGYVECDVGGSKVRSEGRIRCNNKLHFKLGIYSQQMDPIGDECIEYEYVKFEKLEIL